MMDDQSKQLGATAEYAVKRADPVEKELEVLLHRHTLPA